MWGAIGHTGYAIAGWHPDRIMIGRMDLGYIGLQLWPKHHYFYLVERGPERH